MSSFQVNLVGKIKPKAPPRPAAEPAPLHSVTLTVMLSDGLDGTDDDKALIASLRTDIEGALGTSGTLAPEDAPSGSGSALLVISGEDADLIWAAIADLVELRTFNPGSTALKKYSDREEQIDLTTLR